MIFVLSSLVVVHENIHKQIYNYYGIDSEIKYFQREGIGVTITQEGHLCEDACQLAHSINEIVGYNLVLFTAFFGASVIVIIKCLREEI